MTTLPRLARLGWLISTLIVCGFIVWANRARSERTDYVSGLATAAATSDASSPTGYSGGVRTLVLPEHNDASAQWIIQTQEMAASGVLRLRHADYDNAPHGREILLSSPYHWWLRAVASVEQLFSGRNTGQSIERAALLADPALHLLLLLLAAWSVHRFFGPAAAGVAVLGLAALYPLAGSFLAGQPDDHGLVLLFVFGSVIPLLAAFEPGRGDAAASGVRARSRRLFIAAGVLGGVGLWIDPLVQAPILLGLALGAVLAALPARLRSRAAQPSLPSSIPEGHWFAWSVAGAVTCLAAWLIEFAPGNLRGVRLAAVHPLYAVSWIGLGLLVRSCVGGLARSGETDTRPRRGRFRRFALPSLALLAAAAVPLALLRPGLNSILIRDPLSSRLTNLPGSPVAENIFDWLSRDGASLSVLATFLPLLLLIPLCWQLVRTWASPLAPAARLRFVAGPLLLAALLATQRLIWWNVFDLLLVTGFIALLASLAPGPQSQRPRRLLLAAAALLLVPGVALVLRQAAADRQANVSPSELQSLIERDLAQSLARQTGAGQAIVLASPSLTTALIYHGGLRGLVTTFPENKDGFAAAVRIAGATAQDESLSMIERRGVTHIVLATWDSALDEMARLATDRPDDSLVALLHRWLPPRWLRAVPYHLPDIPGFEGQSVAIFQVVELQDNALALSRLGEYFLEMDQPEPSLALAAALEHNFPTDLNALIARAQIEFAGGDSGRITGVFEALLQKFSLGTAALPWDRHIILASVLAQAKAYGPAREELKTALADIDEPRLRSLTPNILYRFAVMRKAFGLEIEDPALRDLAHKLLPRELQEKL